VLQPAADNPQPGASWFDDLKENIETSDDEVCFNSDLFCTFTRQLHFIYLQMMLLLCRTWVVAECSSIPRNLRNFLKIQ
jgi:hypothetical protein